MKKQYSFSLNVDSEAARYMECIRHKMCIDLGHFNTTMSKQF